MRWMSLTVLGLVTAVMPGAFGQIGGGGCTSSVSGATAQYTISTFAGGGPPNGVAAISIAVSNVSGIATDSLGNLYVPSSTQNRVYKVAANGTLTTVAGNGTTGYSGDGGAATSAQLNCPYSVAVDFAGNLYIGDVGNYRIRKVSGGLITTVAGTGNFGFSGDGGPAAAAQISNPYGVAVDSAGNLYFSDSGNCRVRRVSSGVIATVAGTGNCGYSGDGGPAASAQISNLYGVAVDGAGSLYIADTFNYRIRRVSAGVIVTVAGNGTYGYSGDGGAATSAQINNPYGVAVDNAGTLYIADTSNCRIRKVLGGVITTVAGTGFCGYSGDGGLATNSQITSPFGVAVDGAGTSLYIADTNNHRVRRVAGDLINTVAGNGTYQFSGDFGPSVNAQVNPGSIAVSSAGEIYVADVQDYRIRKASGGLINTVVGTGTSGYSGDSGPAVNAQVSTVSGVAMDGAGNQFIADAGNSLVRKVTGGIITAVAGTGIPGYSGDGGLATNAQLSGLQGIATDTSGTLYLTDQGNNRIRKISAGVITMVAGGGPPDGSTAINVSIPGQKTAVDSAGNVYVATFSRNRVIKVSTNGTITTVAGNGIQGYSGDGGAANNAQLNYPIGVAVDGGGNLYFADNNNCRIRRVSGGVITTVAGTGICGFFGDGGPAASAQVNFPVDVAVDSVGNLYIADGNCRIRKVSSGVITTVAGTGSCGFSGDGGPATSLQIGNANGIAVDSSGNLYIADSNNYRVRKVSGGVISTVAGNGTFGYSGDGGPAVSAQVSYANGVAVDGAGGLYIADTGNNVIRKVAAGIITTFAGAPNNCCNLGDGGLATNATLSNPWGAAADSAGNIYIADIGNNRIRKVSGGFINTIAGNGFYSFSGDGGQASIAEISSPSALAVDNSGNLYISDSGNGRVRMVSPGGIISTLAGGGTQGLGDGGPATSAALSYPRGVAVDGSHNVYVVDSGKLRKVSAVGVISSVTTTTAGNGSFSFGGDGGVAVDSSNNVYLSDPGSGRVLRIVPAPVLQIAKTHNINFTQGQNGDTYSVTVSNGVGAGPTNGLVTVTETIPVGLTLVSMSGTGWTCPPGGITCTRSDVLSGGLSYPAITVTINVSPTAPAFVVNQVTVSGGGSADATVIDATTVIGCNITLNPPSAAFPSSGGFGTVAVTTVSACQWTASGNGSWLVVTSQTATSGNGSFNYTVANNGNSTPRSDNISVGNAKFTVTQQVPAGTALRFVPVTPCCIADTRNADGPFGGPVLGTGSSRDFVVPSSSCGIPISAVAYSLNITVVPLGSLGYISVWPTGLPQPVVSTLNSFDGRTKANAAIVPAGVNGAFSVFATNPTHVIVDINGYFVPASDSQNLAFYPLTPCRVADTRNPVGTFGAPSLAGGVPRTFPVPSSACGIPASAQAFAVNMTVVPNAPVGYLSTWPAGSPQPLVSTLNATTGTVTSNFAIVPAGVNGGITVFATDPTHLIIDINGYFAPPGTGSLDFYTANPCRVVDTRDTAGPLGGPIMGAGQARSFNVPSSTCGIPAAAKAYSLNATVLPSASLQYLTLWGSGSIPIVSTLNSFDGTVVSNAALVPAGTSGVVTAFTTDLSHLLLDINGYFR